MATVHPQVVYSGYQPAPSGGYVAYGAPPQSSYATPQGYAPQGNPQPGYAPPQGYYAPPGAMPMPGAPDPGAYNMYHGGLPPQQGIPAGVYQQPPPGMYNPAHAQLPAVGYNGAVAVTMPVYDTPAKQAPAADPANTIETGRWSVGLCDCCNHCFPNLCMSWCCPCVSLAQIYARIALLRYRTALICFGMLVLTGLVVQYAPINTPSSDNYELVQDADGNYSYQASGMILTTLIPTIVWILVQVLFGFSVCFVRGRVRQRFQIPGNPCCDCLLSWLCSCCAIAQMASHVKSYKPGSCDFGGPDVLPAYSG